MPTGRKSDPTRAREAFAKITDQLAELQTLTVAQLRLRYEEVFGEPTRSRNKDYLRKKIAYRIQELAEGGLSARALAKIEELAPDAPVRWRASGQRSAPPACDEPAAPPAEEEAAARDPRLPPPGTVITRAHDGVDHQVVVLEDGFEYQGQRFPTLSKIAKEITGTNWNGFLFFKRALRNAAAAAHVSTPSRGTNWSRTDDHKESSLREMSAHGRGSRSSRRGPKS